MNRTCTGTKGTASGVRRTTGADCTTKSRNPKSSSREVESGTHHKLLKRVRPQAVPPSVGTVETRATQSPRNTGEKICAQHVNRAVVTKCAQ